MPFGASDSACSSPTFVRLINLLSYLLVVRSYPAWHSFGITDSHQDVTSRSSQGTFNPVVASSSNVRPRSFLSYDCRMTVLRLSARPSVVGSFRSFNGPFVLTGCCSWLLTSPLRDRRITRSHRPPPVCISDHPHRLTTGRLFSDECACYVRLGARIGSYESLLRHSMHTFIGVHLDSPKINFFSDDYLGPWGGGCCPLKF